MDQLKLLLNDESVPPYMKLIVDFMAETKAEIAELNRRNAIVLEENKKLREENSMLKAQLDALLSKNVSSKHDVGLQFSSSVGDPDLSRSIVLAGIPESISNSPTERANNDVICVNTILDFLGVECLPNAVYRMGKPSPQKPRLLKVVLPTSRFQKEAVIRAPRLRFFSHRGVYLRPSLSKEERDRRREARQSGKNARSNSSISNRKPDHCVSLNNSSNDVSDDFKCSTPSTGNL
ncbi:hypothetical protein Y032_0378g282 [Ancylostoma ceylanicum]|uniref:Uncharacterized protein n=1 Tax=Ancylostoma ceylanicum TaxID=53326 RepID=A0A016RUF9_9BILA|nr:hypothetical protein Y032_0378g282 [Ancylostoma ceylanicum]